MNQGINFLVADMATEIEAARLLVWQASWLLDQGKRATLQSSYAKRFAADTAMKVTTDAVQIFGGYGYMKEYPVEKLMRDAKLFQIYEGTSQIQRLVIATGDIFSHVSLEIDLSGRVALVTGGSRGLGRADALTLADAGADVVVADILVESDDSAAAELRAARPGGRGRGPGADRGDGARRSGRSAAGRSRSSAT